MSSPRIPRAGAGPPAKVPTVPPQRAVAPHVAAALGSRRLEAGHQPLPRLSPQLCSHRSLGGRGLARHPTSKRRSREDSPERSSAREPWPGCAPRERTQARAARSDPEGRGVGRSSGNQELLQPPGRRARQPCASQAQENPGTRSWADIQRSRAKKFILDYVASVKRDIERDAEEEPENGQIAVLGSHLDRAAIYARAAHRASSEHRPL